MPVTVRRAYADSRYGQTHYRIARPEGAPTAPTLVCLHQTPKSGWEFEPLLAELGQERVVIAPDTPGYGESDGPDTPASIEDFSSTAAELVAGLQAKGELPPGPVDLIGIHTGSVVATEMARSRPDLVRRAVLIGLAAYDAETRADKLAKLVNYPRPKEDLSHVEAIWKVMCSLMDPRTTAQWRHRSLAENLRSGERMCWGYDAVYRYDFRKALGEVQQPVLVLNPEDDLSPFTPEAATLIPNGRRVDFPGVKHGLIALKTAEVAAILREFLEP